MCYLNVSDSQHPTGKFTLTKKHFFEAHCNKNYFYNVVCVLIDQAIKTKQYNSPQSLYSDDSIKEILSQQAETLASGVKG